MAFRRRRTTKKSTNKSSGKIKHEKTIIDGITFDSKMESDYYIKLKEDKLNGLIKDFELQPEFILQDKAAAFLEKNEKLFLGERTNDIKKSAYSC